MTQKREGVRWYVDVDMDRKGELRKMAGSLMKRKSGLLRNVNKWGRAEGNEFGKEEDGDERDFRFEVTCFVRIYPHPPCRILTTTSHDTPCPSRFLPPVSASARRQQFPPSAVIVL